MLFELKKNLNYHKLNGFIYMKYIDMPHYTYSKTWAKLQKLKKR